MPEPRIRICDGSSLDDGADGSELIVCLISRHEVEAGVIGDAVDRMMVLSDSAKHTRNYAGAVVLQFSGYDFDSRELYEIPECVSYFRALTNEWPYWFHFLESKMAESIGVALNLLIDAKQVRSEAGRITATFDKEIAGSVLERLFTAMNNLHQLHGLTVEERKRQSDAVCQFINAYTQGNKGAD